MCRGSTLLSIIISGYLPTCSAAPRSNQDELALAIVEGDVKVVADIVDAYTQLYGQQGFDVVIKFRFDIDQRSLAITLHDSKASDPGNGDSDMFSGLSVLHLACVFDQEDVVRVVTNQKILFSF